MTLRCQQIDWDLILQPLPVDLHAIVESYFISDPLCPIVEQIILVLESTLGPNGPNGPLTDQQYNDINVAIIQEFINIIGFPPIDVINNYVQYLLSGQSNLVDQAINNYYEIRDNLLITIINRTQQIVSIEDSQLPDLYNQLYDPITNLIDNYIKDVVVHNQSLIDQITTAGYDLTLLDLLFRGPGGSNGPNGPNGPNRY